jgi:hypothetical protein
MADKNPTPDVSTDSEVSETGNIINASGHAQELSRNFSLISLAGVGLVVGNVWPAIGGSILVAIFNGGPPGSSHSRAVPLTSANVSQVSCTNSSSYRSSTGSWQHA